MGNETVESVRGLPDQVFLEICEDAALRGVSVATLAKQMNTTRHLIWKRRKELNFAQWFEGRHQKSPKSVAKLGDRDTQPKPQKIDFQRALQKKINDPDFLNKVYKKIAKSQLGEAKA